MANVSAGDEQTIVPEIDPDSPIPLYYQLKTLVLEDIASGKYKPGDRLPTEHELCERFQISRTPAHRALSELASEGVILRAPRRGTFVNPHWVPRHSAADELRLVVTKPEWASHIETNVPEDINVNVATVGYTEIRGALTKAVAEGRAPDIALIDEVWVADFADAGFLLPFDELDPEWVDAEYEPDFVKAFVDEQRYDDHVYAVPEEINVAGLWCRRDLLDAVAAEPPRSWEELSQIARLLAPMLPSDGHVITMPGGHVAGETTSYCLLAVLASNGVRVLNDGVRLDSGPTVDALRFLRSFIDDGTMTSDVVNYEWTRCSQLLGTGRAAMSLGGSYEAEWIANAAGIPLENITEHFSFTPFPGGPNGKPATVAGAMAYAIFRQSSYPGRALRLVQHLVATDQIADRARGHPIIPPRRSAIDLVAKESPLVATAAALFDSAVIRPVIPDYHLVSVQLQNMLEAVLTGRYRPAAAAERTAEIVAAITGLPLHFG